MFLIHAAVFAALLWWSWRRWADPLIDFGRELYVPWQITRGQVLYRDIASLFGPLSPYANAGLFEIFGVSLTTLITCNLVIFALMLAGIHYLVRISSGVLAATTATLCAMLLFGFGQYGSVGNYNFVCPYSHEATHGLALSVAMMVALHLGSARGLDRWFPVAGACFGLTLLTKPEVALAAAVAAGVGFGAMATGPGHGRAILRALGLFVAAALVPALLFFAYFAMHVPPGEALRATAGAWRPLWTGGLTGSQFYERVAGLDQPLRNIGKMFVVFGGCALFVAAAASVARIGVRRVSTASGGSITRRLWILFVAVAIVLIPWFVVPRALPLTTATCVVWLVMLFARRRRERASALRMLPLLMWAALALALLSKIVLNARLSHYGFYLALPATTILVAGLVGLIPEWLSWRYSAQVGATFRRIALWIIAAGIAPYLVVSNSWYRAKVVPIGAGGDLFYASGERTQWRGQATREALDAVLTLSAPGEKVAVLPEGVMLNYLSRRDSALKVVNLMPPELMVFGEADVLRSLRADPPELVLFVQKDVSEYGYPPFGTDARYGRATSTWVREHYRLAQGISRDPNTGEFRITVLKRRTQP